MEKHADRDTDCTSGVWVKSSRWAVCLKALIIGLDGASPFLVQRWIGRLPNLRSLAEQGVHGILESIVPPASVPAWQCFATGKNPARIGIWGFASIDRKRKLVRGRTTAGLGCIWDICSQNGMKVGVFNIPGTFPPYPVKGFMVSGFPAPPGKVWAYPADLMRRLNKAVGGYEIDVPLTKPTEMRGGEKAYLSQVERLHSKSVKSAKLLMDWYEPEVFVMTLQGVDMVQHDFWRYMNKPESQYSGVVQDWYVKLDSAVGELASKVEDDTFVLVVSDHGSIPVSSSFHINEYLRAKGMLKLKDEQNLRSRGANYTRLRELIMRHLPPEVIKALYAAAPNFIAHKLTTSAKIERILAQLIENVDWDRTTAFSTGGVQANIYLNANNGNSHDPDAPTKQVIVESLCDMLEKLEHPSTGEKLRLLFHFREETFKGPFKDEAPDLCVEFFARNEKVHVNPGLGTGKFWSFSPHLSAEHVREGYWAFKGPIVRNGMQVDASILDMAPTLFEALGIDLVPGLDGRILEEIFTDHSLEKSEVSPVIRRS